MRWAQVFNLAPTISSLTAQAPGRYLWRMLIALHSAPRILALLCYWTYYERVLTTYIEPRFRLRLRAAAVKAKASAPLASTRRTTLDTDGHGHTHTHTHSSVAPRHPSPSLVMNATCSRVRFVDEREASNSVQAISIVAFSFLAVPCLFP